MIIKFKHVTFSFPTAIAFSGEHLYIIAVVLIKDVLFIISILKKESFMTHLNVGDVAPDFTLNNEAGEPVTLSSLRGKKVVLFFYPKDDSPSCTKEACSMRDHYRTFEKMDIEIFGISPDNEKKHQKFIDKYEFQYSLLADPEKDVIELYGLWGEKKFMGKIITGVHRTTFVIDEQGIIMDIITKVKTSEHGQQVLESISQTAGAN